jgi:hypothetical protein
MNGLPPISAAACMRQLLSMVWCTVASSSHAPVWKLRWMRVSMQRQHQPQKVGGDTLFKPRTERSSNACMHRAGAVLEGHLAGAVSAACHCSGATVAGGLKAGFNLHNSPCDTLQLDTCLASEKAADGQVVSAAASKPVVRSHRVGRAAWTTQEQQQCSVCMFHTPVFATARTPAIALYTRWRLHHAPLLLCRLLPD